MLPLASLSDTLGATLPTLMPVGLSLEQSILPSFGLVLPVLEPLSVVSPDESLPFVEELLSSSLLPVVELDLSSPPSEFFLSPFLSGVSTSPEPQLLSGMAKSAVTSAKTGSRVLFTLIDYSAPRTLSRRWRVK